MNDNLYSQIIQVLMSLNIPFKSACHPNYVGDCNICEIEIPEGNTVTVSTDDPNVTGNEIEGDIYITDNTTYVFDTSLNEWIELPQCCDEKPTTVVNQTGETHPLTECEFETIDLSVNDTDCIITNPDGSTETVPGVYLLKEINNPNDLEIQYTNSGIVYVKPRDCTKPLMADVKGCIQCPDGTTSVVATDVFTFTPPPLGTIRVDKTQNTTNNEVSSEDVFTYTLTVCNDSSATGGITDITVTDILSSDITYISDDGGTLGSSSIIGQEFTWNIPGPLLPGECASIDINVEVTSTSGFEFISNTVKASGNDGTGPDSTVDYDIDVVNELEEPSTTVITSDIDFVSGDVDVTLELTKTSGNSIGCGECLTLFIKDLSGNILMDFQGITCNDISTFTNYNSNWFPNNGTLGHNTTFIFNKKNFAFDNGLGAENHIEYVLEAVVGGTCAGVTDPQCPLPSTMNETDNIPKVFATGGDNQSWFITSNDGTTTTFDPNFTPHQYPNANPEGDIMGNIVQAPSNAVSPRAAGGFSLFDIWHNSSDTITLDQIIFDDGSVVTGLNTVLFNNPGNPRWDYPLEVAPAIISNVTGISSVTQLVGGVSQSAVGANFVHWLSFHGEGILPYRAFLIHSRNPSVPIIIEFLPLLSEQY